jgi:hypothetical protein
MTRSSRDHACKHAASHRAGDFIFAASGVRFAVRKGPKKARNTGEEIT